MAYDETLAARIRDLLEGEAGLIERKMFGGLGFMLDGNMAVAAASSGSLMVRADPASVVDWVSDDVQPIVMNNRELKGWLLVTGPPLTSDQTLEMWLDRGVEFARTLPPKVP